MDRLHYYSTTGGVCLLLGAFCGGLSGGGLNNPSGLLPRQAGGQRATVSRGRDRASVRKCPEQWGISKLANGKKPTGLFARKHLLAPYTGEAIVRMTPSAPSGHLPQTHPKKILRLFLGTPGREARGIAKLRQLLPQSCRRCSIGRQDSSLREGAYNMEFGRSRKYMLVLEGGLIADSTTPPSHHRHSPNDEPPPLTQGRLK